MPLLSAKPLFFTDVCFVAFPSPNSIQQIKSKRCQPRMFASLLLSPRRDLWIMLPNCLLWSRNRTLGTGENRTSEPRPLGWTLSWALPWTPSRDVLWKLWWGLQGLKTGRINPHGCSRGCSRGRGQVVHTPNPPPLKISFQRWGVCKRGGCVKGGLKIYIPTPLP